MNSERAFAINPFDDQRPKVDTKPTAPTRLSFAPNQLAANAWYRPGSPGRVINGHLDESFGRRERWPGLLRNLARLKGRFGIGAAEIGHLRDRGGLLELLRSEGIAVSVEVPAFTQPHDGAWLARAELRGEPVDGMDIFSRIFQLERSKDRNPPQGTGWFVTRDGTPFVPDELVFDERIPNLLPEFDAAILARTPGSWDQRKQAARKPSAYAATRQPFDRLLRETMQDYVEYLRVARAHWGDRMPDVCIHWNVNPGWEWRDERGLDAVQASKQDWCRTPDDFYRVVFDAPQYRSVEYLNALLDLLTGAGFRPRTVLMDVDWTYSIPYVAEVLRRHKTPLAARGVQMGINVVEASLGEHDELVHAAGTLRKRSNRRALPNRLYEDTLVAIVEYLLGSGILDPGMQIRVGSWSRRPSETGAEIDERVPGSLAHAANRIARMI